MHDDILKDFVNESLEHLSNIENDLIQIEKDGENLDDELVNKVFRAAHSIKGSSAALGLEKVLELSHMAETLLDRVRYRKILPDADVINILLLTFDRLKDLISNPDKESESDNEALLEDLKKKVFNEPASESARDDNSIYSSEPTDDQLQYICKFSEELAKNKARFVYLIQVSGKKKKKLSKKKCLELIESMNDVGTILNIDHLEIENSSKDKKTSKDKKASKEKKSGKDKKSSKKDEPCRIILASVLEPDILGDLFESIDPEVIVILNDPNKIQEKKQISEASKTSERRKEVRSGRDRRKQSRRAEDFIETTKPRESSPVKDNETIRVNVNLLEDLMNLAGELVLSRNQLRSAVSNDVAELIASAEQRIDLVTSEIQDAIMQTRLQPVGNVFNRIPRLVRDLCQTLSKEIELEIYGKDVALDKTLIEALADPLIHLVRNAVDHGIESADERTAAGKITSGRVKLEARHEAGQVVIELFDDGGGIDPEHIGEAAVEKGLISREAILRMSEQEKQELIFLPGFSSAEEITDISGRGFGMDVVKTNLEKLGGTVEIKSELGEGTTFRIKLPLTLAIIPSLIVSIDGAKFAIPQVNIEELLRLKSDEVASRIERVGNANVLLLRDRMLPIIDLSGMVARKKDEPEVNDNDSNSPEEIVEKAKVSKALEIAVVNTGSMHFALIVEDFHDTEEVVVKPLGSRLKNLKQYSGATILGDGRIALILDAAGMAHKSGIFNFNDENISKKNIETELITSGDLQSLLLFHNGGDISCAIPLPLVQRIERIKYSQIEQIGSRRTMQYRSSFLPLVSLSDASSFPPIDDKDKELIVLVSRAHNREIGLLCNKPLDVIETQIEVDEKTHRQSGIAGSSIINGLTTYFVDLFELVDAAYPQWKEKTAATRASMIDDTDDTPTVLFVEDSSFFRTKIKKYLENEGLVVMTAEDGVEAWSLLQKYPDRIKILITDIEMPNMNGLELAKRVRNFPKTEKMPIIALTSLASDADINRGAESGIDDYQIKMDRDQLITSIHTFLRKNTVKDERN